MPLPYRELAAILFVHSRVALSSAQRWLRGGEVTDDEAARLTIAAARLGLTTAELGPRVRLHAPPPVDASSADELQP